MFTKGQKVVVNYNGNNVVGTIKKVLSEGKKFNVFLEEEEESITTSVNNIVDYETYTKKKNKNDETSKKGKIKEVEEVEEAEDSDLDWGDLDEDDDTDLDDEDLDEDDDTDLDDEDLDEDDDTDLDEDEDTDENDEDLDEDENEDDETDENEEDLDDAYSTAKLKKNNVNKIEETEDIGDGWFSIGDEDDERFASLPNTTKRFWLQRGNSTLLTIITEKPFTFREHRVRIAGRSYNLTCLATAGVRCPLCEIGNRATPKKAFYVIDHTKYFSKSKNKEIKHSLAIWSLGTRQYALVKAAVQKYFKNENFNYRGVQIEVRRSTDNLAPNCGDIFFVEGVTKKDIFKGDYDKGITDLAKELKPLGERVLRAKLPSIENFTYDDE